MSLWAHLIHQTAVGWTTLDTATTLFLFRGFHAGMVVLPIRAEDIHDHMRHDCFFLF